MAFPLCSISGATSGSLRSTFAQMGTIHSLLMLISFLPSVIGEVQCFTQPSPSRPQLHRPGRQDCLFMAEFILEGDKAHAPMHWGRQKGMGWRLPYMWDIWGKSCFVSMDMLPGYYEDEVVFAPDEVASTALNIINTCQVSPSLPKLGGRELVGPEAKTIVILAGKIPETGPRPPRFRGRATWFHRFNGTRNTS